MPRKTLADEFLDGLGNAIADVREKVVEEPWYGRAVTERGHDCPQWPEARESGPSLEDMEKEHAHEHEIDR